MYLTIFGKPRYLGLVVAEDDAQFEKGEQLLVESSRGLEIAVVAGEVTERQEALYRSIDNRQEGQPGNDSGLQNVTYLRRVLQEDLEKESLNRDSEEEALITARQVLSRHDLDMKLVDVEYMNDRKKLFLYFTSEQRVDFRAYVRDLAREFRTRIELRQIGVRDESKVVKGLGACGRVCCCSYWLQRFMPIGIKMVKEQNLALNPTKISGLCGRLMCCMSFEQETYHELWKGLPSHGAKIKTEQGTWVLAGVDLAAQNCVLHGPAGTVSIPISMYQEFKETVLSGKAWINEEHGLDEKGQPIRSAEDDFLIPTDGKHCAKCSACANHPAAPHFASARAAAAPLSEEKNEADQKGQKEPRKNYHRRRALPENTTDGAEARPTSPERHSAAQSPQHYRQSRTGQNPRHEPRKENHVSADERHQRTASPERQGENPHARRNPHRPVRRGPVRKDFAADGRQADSAVSEKGSC